MTRSRVREVTSRESFGPAHESACTTADAKHVAATLTNGYGVCGLLYAALQAEPASHLSQDVDVSLQHARTLAGLQLCRRTCATSTAVCAFKFADDSG